MLSNTSPVLASIKGQTAVDKAAYYCPYIPLQYSDTNSPYKTIPNRKLRYKINDDETYEILETLSYKNVAFISLIDWLNKYCPDSQSYMDEDVSGGLHFFLKFNNSKEHVLFKLTWL
jgi:hypothetical protein